MRRSSDVTAAVAVVIDIARNRLGDRGMAESAEEQLPDLREAATRPHVMDNATIDRVLQIYGEQKADLWLYAEQLQRWRNQSPTPVQATEITQLEQRLAALRTAIDELLVLAQQRGPQSKRS